MDKLTDSICRFDKFLQESNSAEDKQRLRYLPPITNFMTYMIKVYKEAEIAVNGNLHASRVKLGI